MESDTFSAEAETADSQAFQISTKNDIPLHFSTNFFAQPVDIVNNLVENLRFKDFYCG